MFEAAGLHAFLRSRRSIRHFRDEPVRRDVVERIIESATHAVSAHNAQPWRFQVVSEAATREQLAAAMELSWRRDLEDEAVTPEIIGRLQQRSRRRLQEAPVVIVLCLDASTLDRFSDKRRQKAAYVMGVQSVAAAGQLLLLAAHAEGLGGVWICSPLFAPEAVRDVLALPRSWEAQAMFYLGHPERGPSEKHITPLQEIVRWQ